jgi:hypothetical protein
MRRSACKAITPFSLVWMCIRIRLRLDGANSGASLFEQQRGGLRSRRTVDDSPASRRSDQDRPTGCTESGVGSARRDAEHGACPHADARSLSRCRPSLAAIQARYHRGAAAPVAQRHPLYRPSELERGASMLAILAGLGAGQTQFRKCSPARTDHALRQSLARSLLVEAVWSYRYTPKVRRIIEQRSQAIDPKFGVSPGKLNCG